MCFVCRDLRECAPCEQSVGSWMTAILKTVVYLLLGFSDCQLCSSAAVRDSRLVRIFVSVCDTQKMCWNWARNCRITLICPSLLYLFPSFSLSVFPFSVFLAFFLLFFFLVCCPSSFPSFLRSTCIALSFLFLSPFLPFFPTCFFSFLVYSFFLCFFSSVFLSFFWLVTELLFFCALVCC